MNAYKIVRNSDAKDFFVVEGTNKEEALYDALAELGWHCVELKHIDYTMGEINELLGYGDEQ